jgi:hypothetical protein
MAERILAISAHPADFCSRSGGALILHARAGAQVKVIWLSHGEADESGLLYEQQPDILLTHWKNELTYPTHLMTATPPCGRR